MNILLRCLVPIAVALCVLQAHAQQSGSAPSLPVIRKTGAAAQLFVDGAPWIMLAGELHNSSASSAEYMAPIWDRLSALHLNTVIGTASWELIEPQEGKFDFALVDAQVAEARRRGMRLVLIWFATWKNASSTYAPLWVKTDTRRFPRAQTKPRPDLRSPLSAFFASTMAAPNLSAFGADTARADAQAFAALMRHLRQADPQHTVVMMQVENETGLLGDSRDRSPLAEAAWSKAVPAELITYLVRNKTTLLPELTEVWAANGYKTSGTWAQVFGSSNQADEIFMAWYVGRYVGQVIEAGRAELPIPMYVNAWLGPQPGMDQPGQYPSGGPVARVMDVWRAAAPAVDLLAPDIYVPEFKATCALYARSGNPLFIPEALPIVGNLFWALGHHRAMGFSPFGIEDVKPDSQIPDAYRALGQMLPVLAKAQSENNVVGVLLDREGVQTEHLAGYTLEIRSSRAPIQLDAGQTPAEPSNTAQGGGPGSRTRPDMRPYGIVISTAPDEFLIVGSGLLVNFISDSPGKVAEIGSIDEGRFVEGRWTAGRRLNGDEGRPVLPGDHLSMIKIRLYRRDR